MGILSGSYKYMKGRGRAPIPSEVITPAGNQLSMLPHAYGSVEEAARAQARRGQLAQTRINTGTSRPAPVNTGFMGRPRAAAVGVPPRPSPPWKGGSKPTPGDPRAKVMGAARREELAQKDAEAAIGQTLAIDDARRAGQVTNREAALANRRLVRRRKRALNRKMG